MQVQWMEHQPFQLPFWFNDDGLTFKLEVKDEILWFYPKSEFSKTLDIFSTWKS